MEVTVFFEKNDKLFSCVVEQDINNCSLIGYGTSAQKAEDDLENLRKEYNAMGKNIPELNIVERRFDIGSLFNYYPINISQFATYSGINASLLRQYVSGHRAASKKRQEQIENAIKVLGHKLLSQSRILI
ncbi:hypothetical protein HMPREF9296_2510 [Prevotella disiens FB035-09AN]|uniref:Toxin-antitoxin system, antitoxin component, HicB family n=1 Tax=Prevotella disiens FB035-09AN TaxID=866771 RepID=E1KNX4_9BACT|nr:hypothetical protein [Prevotella disiens]EFL46949.1 hypothetical protein HMPREF9296_2510 [Prevotella disiens FB035-09AN]